MSEFPKGDMRICVDRSRDCLELLPQNPERTIVFHYSSYPHRVLRLRMQVVAGSAVDIATSRDNAKPGLLEEQFPERELSDNFVHRGPWTSLQ